MHVCVPRIKMLKPLANAKPIKKAADRDSNSFHPLHFIVVVVEIDVLWPQAVAPDELLVSRWTLVLCVARQHALQRHANTLNILNRTPALLTQEVETYDAVRIDVRMYWYWSVGLLDEGHFGRLYWVLGPESKHQSEGLVEIERIVVEDFDIEVPCLEVVGRNEGDASWEAAIDFIQLFSEPLLGKVGTHGNWMYEMDGEVGSRWRVKGAL